MAPRKRKSESKPATSESKSVANVEPGNSQAEHNENYDPSITLTHNADGLWFWEKDGKRSEVGYNHPSMARLMAPSDSKAEGGE